MTTEPKKIGVSLHAASGTGNLVDDVVGFARAAAAAGVGAVWLGQRFDYDAVALAGIVGREVPGIRVGTSAVPIYGRHPLPLAAAAQTAQAATHGRFTLGVALSSKALVEPVFGVPHHAPARHLAEYLTVLRTVFTTGGVDHEGETLTARSPLPTALPGAEPPDVLVAAMGPRALATTGELGDGILPFLAGPRALAEEIVPTLHRSAARPQRVVALVPAVVTDDRDTVRAAAEESLAFYDTIPSYRRVVALSGAERAAELALIGDEEAVARGIEDYFAAGATEVVVTRTDLGGPEAQHRTLRLLGRLAD
ncbi:TIGR03564 family F420-dependent LLM class oxidoreductase [Actinokineospora sp. PR83]|uniref:TIGR03564 family F420-dependent LLM class oxidoreductase n=1 Tax=Actinokineospora sp. PR83 TaxID=2884908 RepID=UPI001F29A79B|nr:TIGR03564 family F420-dependent LLM class oxidoreductase [Actinokineospora sp. PR83]MCG8915108.1 TIGR03564 family F420-dependent LLM class oxidoreductase [Actinokineospora sp. PR83]